MGSLHRISAVESKCMYYHARKGTEIMQTLQRL